MFERSAPFYDAVFGPRHDYATASATLYRLIERRGRIECRRLLDVGCGTGAYLPHFGRFCRVEGVDASEAMLEVARRRNPGVPFHRANLVDFDLGRRFDAVVCLGSSIGYATTPPELASAARSLARHTVEGGVVLVEPWLEPDAWEVGRVTADLTDEPDLKVARILVSGGDGARSILDVHHLVATAAGVESFVERHEMGLFRREEYEAALEAAGLDVEHDPGGPLGRGLYAGLRRADG